jgi:hypothetical protein
MPIPIAISILPSPKIQSDPSIASFCDTFAEVLMHPEFFHHHLWFSGGGLIVILLVIIIVLLLRGR